MKHVEYLIAAVAFLVGVVFGIVIVGELGKNVPVDSVVLYDRTYHRCLALSIQGYAMNTRAVKCPSERRGR